MKKAKQSKLHYQMTFLCLRGTSRDPIQQKNKNKDSNYIEN